MSEAWSRGERWWPGLEADSALSAMVWASKVMEEEHHVKTSWPKLDEEVWQWIKVADYYQALMKVFKERVVEVVERLDELDKELGEQGWFWMSENSVYFPENIQDLCVLEVQANGDYMYSFWPTMNKAAPMSWLVDLRELKWKGVEGGWRVGVVEEAVVRTSYFFPLVGGKLAAEVVQDKRQAGPRLLVSLWELMRQRYSSGFYEAFFDSGWRGEAG